MFITNFFLIPVVTKPLVVCEGSQKEGRRRLQGARDHGVRGRHCRAGCRRHCPSRWSRPLRSQQVSSPAAPAMALRQAILRASRMGSVGRRPSAPQPREGRRDPRRCQSPLQARCALPWLPCTPSISCPFLPQCFPGCQHLAVGAGL